MSRRKCKHPRMRKLVDVTVDCPVACRRLSKAGIRERSVTVMAANWEHERYYCPDCGWIQPGRTGS